MATPLTIYMFGYWGWGNATAQLVEAMDAVENSRGRKPPLFVDIRVHRGVRAAAFRDDAFERTVGPPRHRWMPDLGNLSVLPKHRSDRVRIKSPQAARELLDLAVDCAKRKQSVIYFCSCDLPCDCHRHTVAELLIKAAKGRGTTLQVVEWPGGEPVKFALSVPRAQVPKDDTSRLYLASPKPLSKYAGLALGSLVHVTGEDRHRTVAVAPAMYAPKGWYLPILQDEQGKVIKGTIREAHDWRKECGYLPLRTGAK